jgi:hypothetical protein
MSQRWCSAQTEESLNAELLCHLLPIGSIIVSVFCAILSRVLIIVIARDDDVQHAVITS